MKEVEAIQIVFENVTMSNIIYAKDIEYIIIKDINTEIQTIGYNCIAKQQIANNVHIELNKNANQYFDEFGEQSDEKLFERITSYNDITSIEILFNDNTMDIIYPIFDGDTNNSAQSSAISDNGNLIITIHK